MILLKTLLVLAYVIFIFLNYNRFIKGKVGFVLTAITVTFSLFMLCSSNVADLDLTDTGLDLSGYRTIYETYDVLHHEDFSMYYLFYGSMHVGQQLGFSYRLWWTVMSIFAMSIIILSCKIHKYNINLFLATFMAYYELVFYSGLKFFYGFCFLLLAYGFLLKNTRKGQIFYILFTCVSGGFHMMYYFFLILLIKPAKRPKAFVTFVVFITIIYTLFMRVNGSALSYMTFFFDALDNEHINLYTISEVHYGFYFAIAMHLFVLYWSYNVRKFLNSKGIYSVAIDTFYYTIFLSIIFFPFYAISLTFMRLLTSFSLVAVSASSILGEESRRTRSLCVKMSVQIVMAYYIMRVAMGGAYRFIEASIIPFFDVL